MGLTDDRVPKGMGVGLSALVEPQELVLMASLALTSP